MIGKDVEKHAIFVRDWPAGKWGSGSLPDDVKQNLKISMLELDVEKIMERSIMVLLQQEVINLLIKINFNYLQAHKLVLPL